MSSVMVPYATSMHCAGAYYSTATVLYTVAVGCENAKLFDSLSTNMDGLLRGDPHKGVNGCGDGWDPHRHRYWCRVIPEVFWTSSRKTNTKEDLISEADSSGESTRSHQHQQNDSMQAWSANEANTGTEMVLWPSSCAGSRNSRRVTSA